MENNCIAKIYQTKFSNLPLVNSLSSNTPRQVLGWPLRGYTPQWWPWWLEKTAGSVEEEWSHEKVWCWRSKNMENQGNKRKRFDKEMSREMNETRRGFDRNTNEWRVEGSLFPLWSWWVMTLLFLYTMSSALNFCLSLLIVAMQSCFTTMELFLPISWIVLI